MIIQIHPQEVYRIHMAKKMVSKRRKKLSVLWYTPLFLSHFTQETNAAVKKHTTLEIKTEVTSAQKRGERSRFFLVKNAFPGLRIHT